MLTNNLTVKKNLLDRSILAQVVGQFHVLVELVAEAVIKPEDLDQSFTNGQISFGQSQSHREND